VVAATDPHHPDHVAARTEYTDIFGADVDPRDWAPTSFEIGQINRELAQQLRICPWSYCGIV